MTPRWRGFFVVIMITENFHHYTDHNQVEEPAPTALSRELILAVEQRLFSPYDYMSYGTMGLAKEMEALIELEGVSISPIDIISTIARSEEMMEKMEVMWDEVSSGNLENYPFILAVLHSQLPLAEMNESLRERVKDYPKVPYSIDTFSPSYLCSKAEGFLSTAIKTRQAGSDGQSFLIKTSRGVSGEQVGLTAGVSSSPALAWDDEEEKVIVPFIWYRPQSQEVKESIGTQIYQDTGTLLVPGSTWQVSRQFEELDFSEMYGRSLRSAQRVVFDRMTHSQLNNDEGGVSHI